MIQRLNEISSTTNEGRLAMALIATITTTTAKDKTPDEVIATANKLIVKMYQDPVKFTPNLAAVSTKALVAELRTRPGVAPADVDFDSTYGVANDGILELEGEGPVIILVVTD